ncbi:hypothetical protein Nepgr_019307 [Nepenthes gracilis]|uniref:Glycosyltransferase n=1 Tax=Nepenthes gracilis TaxID=150966 RepID=A0AAD3SWS6_NEPGR|nr:hypothetical protein Nepgr_019307 [Nepenthes gracilis]
MKMEKKAKIVVMVPYPAQGHVTPMLKLATSFLDFGFRPVLVVPEFIQRRMRDKVGSAGEGIRWLWLQDGLDERKGRDFFAIEEAMENRMPVHLERLIRKMTESDGEDDEGGVAFVVVDLLASWAIDVAQNRCRVPTAGFWPAMLSTYSLITAIPDLLKRGLISQSGIPKHEGAVLFEEDHPLILRTEDLPWLIGTTSASKSRFKFWARILSRSRSLQWLLVNSSQDDHIERLNSTAIMGRQSMKLGLSRRMRSWVSPVTEAEVRNIASALEESRVPYIWALGPRWPRCRPIVLPTERVSRQGRVVAWAPQVEILQHSAVGCFLTHCGWNSTLEGIQSRKCLLCYPIAGDQFLNCAYIVRVWKIGVRIEDFSVGGVRDGIKRVMEDGEMKKRMLVLNEMIMGEQARSKRMDNMRSFIEGVEVSAPLKLPFEVSCS